MGTIPTNPTPTPSQVDLDYQAVQNLEGTYAGDIASGAPLQLAVTNAQQALDNANAAVVTNNTQTTNDGKALADAYLKLASDATAAAGNLTPAAPPAT